MHPADRTTRQGRHAGVRPDGLRWPVVAPAALAGAVGPCVLAIELAGSRPDLWWALALSVGAVAILLVAHLRQRGRADELARLAASSADDLEQLRAVDEMKTASLTAVSHDLRTPLAVIRGGLETLLVHAERLAPEQLTLILARLQAQGSRLEQMLADLLDLDRLQRGVLVPVREPAELVAVAVRVVDGMAATTHPIRLDGGEVHGVVDTGHVSRILENLVGNAVKYTPDGTPVWVELRRHADGVLLVVADAGPGVPDDQKERIFEPFVRGDDDHTSPGTGVGLDLVRRLAELHGGRAWVDDRPGGGARFWVTLPDDRALDAAADAVAPPLAVPA